MYQVRYALEKKNRRDVVKMAAMKPDEDSEEGGGQGVSGFARGRRASRGEWVCGRIAGVKG